MSYSDCIVSRDLTRYQTQIDLEAAQTSAWYAEIKNIMSGDSSFMDNDALMEYILNDQLLIDLNMDLVTASCGGDLTAAASKLRTGSGLHWKTTLIKKKCFYPAKEVT